MSSAGTSELKFRPIVVGGGQRLACRVSMPWMIEIATVFCRRYKTLLLTTG